MPTYRYRCERCGDEMEVWQSFTEEPLAEHDTACGGHLLRVLTPAGIVLKGPGFYKTDSRSSGKKHSAKPAKDKGSDSNGSDSKGSDSNNGSSSDSSSSKKDATSSTPASTSSGSSGSQ